MQTQPQNQFPVEQGIPYNPKTMTQANLPQNVAIGMPQNQFGADGRQIISTVAAPTVATSKSPQMFYCTNCHKTLVTNVRYKTGVFPIIFMILLFILLLPVAICLCFVSPNRFKTAIHTCPQCGREVGRVK